MNEAVKTRNLYRFEDIYFKSTPVTKLRSMAELRSMAKRLMKNPPKIIASKGIKYNGRYLSYQLEDEIHLVRNQREYLTLVHELVHAMGYDYHDRKFVDCYFDILESEFGLHRGELELAAGLYGVER